MTKQKNTSEQKEIIRHETEDPIDGTKLVGCLFIGVVILIVIGAVFGALINHFR